MTKPSAKIIAAIARRASSTAGKNYPSIFFGDVHISRPRFPALLSQAMPGLIKASGATEFLFELTPELKIPDVEKHFREDGLKSYKLMCERSEIVYNALTLSNEKYGTKFDPDELTFDNVTKCVAGLTLSDCAEAVSKALPKLDKIIGLSLAGILMSIGDKMALATLSKKAVEVLGTDHCHHVDCKTEKLFNTEESIFSRNVHIVTEGILKIPNAIGCFGIGHFEGLINILTGIHSAQTNPTRLPAEAVEYAHKLPMADPRKLIFIFPYLGNPLDENDKGLREEMSQYRNELFPIYTFDATKETAESFPKRVMKIAEKHREKFPALEDYRISDSRI